MTTKYFLLSTILFISCNTSTTRNKDKKIVINTDSSNQTRIISKHNTTPVKTHLHDTTLLKGNFILFLRPDDERFNNYAKDEDGGIYEADSDFGFGIQATIDTVAKYKIYKGINVLVSTNRYILIKDCKYGPLTIDRDTIDYGIILSSKDKEIMTACNQIHSVAYTGEIDDYFHIKK